jgi:hypothetical protein
MLIFIGLQQHQQYYLIILHIVLNKTSKLTTWDTL